jgi:hypothetical protein
MRGGERPDAIDVLLVGAELPGKILSLDVRLRTVAGCQLPHLLVQDIGRAVPENDADLQVFRGIGRSERSRPGHRLSFAAWQCMSRHIEILLMRPLTRGGSASGVAAA